ncbi:thioredoxin fold domain-containing protein [Solilutibacter silvestris]|uniref:Thiol:disulfide interchange protein n=1 Tax=Solilutibacter silvestris TaxID=1645665 RepID=A0A2K1Q2J4_9GAMM|nr:thioredoxin fold domain-containing protein [Lysobacter silvestris]PNS09253.1 Thioredoxin-like domain-containing protein [Lysobacter silvestris]
MRLLFATAMVIASLTACAKPIAAETAKAAAAKPAPLPVADAIAKPAAGSPEARAIDALHKVNPDLKVDHAAAAPLPGFRELIVAGQTLYVSDDGRYVLQGNLYDVAAKKDVSQSAMATLRREELAKVPASQRIVFAPAKPKYTVSVFTDIQCGYCQKLHSQIAQYNAQGIAIEYLAFPRMGLASDDFSQMEAVWCSADRGKALTEAKNGRRINAPRCTNPVAMEYNLGQRLGLAGTPMIVAPNGMAAPGYLDPTRLRQWLDAMATQ